MIGINVDNLDTLIKKHNNCFDEFSDNADNLLDCFNELDDFYDGRSLQFLFYDLSLQKKNISNILSITKSYVDVLSNVKKGYIAQDSNVTKTINNINSN